jgi:hypothetical protein
MKRELATESEAIRRGSERLSQFLASEVLALLSEAAQDDEAWAQAIRAPREFLEGRGLEMPDDVDVALYEAAIPSTGQSSQAYEAMTCEQPGFVLQLQTVPVYTCTKRGYILAREWDPDLHAMVPRVTAEFCLQWAVKFEQRWYCGLAAAIFA